MGATGNATGTHLHFALKSGSQAPYGGASGSFDNNKDVIPYIYSTNRMPIGVVDTWSGGSGTISVSGWAFDQDESAKSISVHVYLDNTYVGALPANIYRSDVNNAHKITGNHGFSGTLTTSIRGTHEIKVYAIDSTGGNNNTLLSQEKSRTVTITDPPSDAIAPTIHNVTVDKYNRFAFTVRATASDYVEATSATLQVIDGTGIWHQIESSEIRNNSIGKEFVFDVSRTQVFVGDIDCALYVRDAAGNSSSYDVEPFLVACDEAHQWNTSHCEVCGLLKGDANENGTLNAVDAQLAYDVAQGRYAIALPNGTTNYYGWHVGNNSNVNDGQLDATDAFAIQYAALHGWE